MNGRRFVSIQHLNCDLLHSHLVSVCCTKGKLSMKQINWGRVVLGGLLAGVVINTFEFVLNFFVLKKAWIAAKNLKPDIALMTGAEIAALNIWGFLVGLLALWLYASIRPRYGSGPKTGIYAGTAIWGLVTLLAPLRPTVGASLPMTAVVTSVVAGFAAINLGTLLGAWQYREPDNGSAGVGVSGA